MRLFDPGERFVAVFDNPTVRLGVEAKDRIATNTENLPAQFDHVDKDFGQSGIGAIPVEALRGIVEGEGRHRAFSDREPHPAIAAGHHRMEPDVLKNEPIVAPLLCRGVEDGAMQPFHRILCAQA